jgi:AhpD family alkylhydroperoxidase
MTADEPTGGLAHERSAHQVRRALGELGREAPDVMGAIGKLHRAATRDGALDARVKELMAVAVAVAMGCDGCVSYHLEAAARFGATRQQATEALEVAVLMAGGPGSVHAAEALPLVQQLPSG